MVTFAKDKDLQAKVLALTQKYSGTSVKFENFEKGSVKITLSGSLQELERLVNAIESGEFGKDIEQLGLSIKDSEFFLEKTLEEVEEDLRKKR